jgi:hypothetical protein
MEVVRFLETSVKYETATPSLEAHIDTFTAMPSYLNFTCWVSHFSMKIRFLAYYT